MQLNKYQKMCKSAAEIQDLWFMPERGQMMLAPIEMYANEGSEIFDRMVWDGNKDFVTPVGGDHNYTQWEQMNRELCFWLPTLEEVIGLLEKVHPTDHWSSLYKEFYWYVSNVYKTQDDDDHRCVWLQYFMWDQASKTWDGGGWVKND